MELTHSFTKLL